MTCDADARKSLADAQEAVERIRRFEEAAGGWRGFGLNLPHYHWHETHKQSEEIAKLVSALLQKSKQA